MKRYEIVEFLKGYSIFTIMLFHYLEYLQLPSPFNNVISFGGTGVHLFVLLSGFGLYYSYLGKPIKYGTFIKRRLTKIYLPYIFIVLIAAVISMFLPMYDNSLYALGGHLFLYKMFDETIIGSYGYQLWFISMILQFYFTFHFIVYIKSKLNNKWFMITGIAISLSWAVLVFILNKGNERVWNSFFLQFYWEFALGMVIAERVYKNEVLIGKNINQILLFAIALVNCALYGLLALKGGDTGKLFNDIFALTGYSLIAVGIYNFNFKPINQLFLYIGKISVSVYLLHLFVLALIYTLFNNLNPIYIVVLSLILIIPLSAQYQKVVNKFFTYIKL